MPHTHPKERGGRARSVEIHLDACLIRPCSDGDEGGVSDDAVARAKAARHVPINSERRRDVNQSTDLGRETPVTRADGASAIRCGISSEEVIPRPDVQA